LVRFVRENARNIATQYCFPNLPWQLGSLLFLVALPKVAKASTVACRCRQRFRYRCRTCKRSIKYDRKKFYDSGSRKMQWKGSASRDGESLTKLFFSLPLKRRLHRRSLPQKTQASVAFSSLLQDPPIANMINTGPYIITIIVIIWVTLTCAS
jgi:hypothetical protein